MADGRNRDDDWSDDRDQAGDERRNRPRPWRPRERPNPWQPNAGPLSQQPYVEAVRRRPEGEEQPAEPPAAPSVADAPAPTPWSDQQPYAPPPPEPLPQVGPPPPEDAFPPPVVMPPPPPPPVEPPPVAPPPVAPPPVAPPPVLAPAPAPLPPHRRRRRIPVWLVAFAALLAFAVGAAAVAAVVVLPERKSNNAARGNNAAGTCGKAATLRVAAAPDIAPVLDAAAKAVAPPTGSCQPITVTAHQGAPDKDSADVWVPASSIQLRTQDSGYGSGTSLARTPVVVVAPEAFARTLGWPDKQRGWAELAALTYDRRIPKFSAPNPSSDPTGLLAVLGTYAGIARVTPDPGMAQLRALTFRSRLADPEAKTDALLTQLQSVADPAAAMRDVGLFPATEQALWRHQRAGHPLKLVAIYPPDGLMEADYPLALNSAIDAGSRELADKLAAWFRTPDGVNALAEAGFRRGVGAPADLPNVAPNAPGLLGGYATPTQSNPDPKVVQTLVNQWAKYRQLTYQVLVLIDGSASMNEPVRDRSGRLTTKAGLLREAGVQAAQLFGEETSLGMWLFASPPGASAPYTEVVPFGPLNEKINGTPRREVLARAAGTYQAYPKAGTPLYESVLRGYENMKARVRPNMVTLVVVLSDGRDQDSGYAMSKQQFDQRLAKLRDPAKPLPVFCIGYGADADMPTLNSISQQTGGTAAQSTDPGDLASAMARIFLAAHQADR